jgi:penicillin-binding protein 1A
VEGAKGSVVRFSSNVSLWTRIKRAALAFDSWVDASLFESARRSSDAWRRYSELMAKLRVRGASRVVFEVAGEATTIGVAGAIAMLTLAQPAFHETSENWLKRQDLAVTFLDRYGTEVGRRGIKHDDSVKLDEMPDYLIKAALATEDRRFFEHWGIDPIGTARALAVNARGGGVVQGGSTITQQLAKNLFLSNERSLERKIKEAFLAVWLEFHLPKSEILKLYFDRAYMGGGTFGVAAAADYGRPRARQRRPQQHGRGGFPHGRPDPDGAPQSGDAGRPPAGGRGRLLPRLGLRAGQEAVERRQARQ